MNGYALEIYFNDSIITLINNLGEEDKMLAIGNAYINILPIIMTIINFISSALYTKGFSLKEKAQPFILAIVFLILLYKSPAALVIYWTMNNILSIVKIVYKNYIKIKIQNIIHKYKSKNIAFHNGILNFFNYKTNTNNSFFLIIFSIFSFVLLAGIVIPSKVIMSSPSEFEFFPYTPINLLEYCAIIFLGLGIWIFIFYMFSKNKNIFSTFFLSLVVYFLINHLFYLNNIGRISTMLVYDKELLFEDYFIIISNFFIFIIIFILIYILNKYTHRLFILPIILFCSLLFFSFYNTKDIVISERKAASTNEQNIKKESNDALNNSNKVFTTQDIKFIDNEYAINENNMPKVINASKNGKNIFVFVLDRFISSYFPYVLETLPELKNQLKGFTYYPNTVTFGYGTIAGSPEIYGGYEYIPYEADKRLDTLVNKHNEALKVMPTVLSENDYNVVIGDMPYENYEDDSLPFIYASISNASKKYLYGNIRGKAIDDNIDNTFNKMKRNFVFYSFFRISPYFLKEHIYDKGSYMMKKTNDLYYDNIFLKSFIILENLKNMINITNDDSNNYFVTHNNTTHQNSILPYPSFYPMPSSNDKFDEEKIDEVFNGSFTGDYHLLNSDIASIKQLGDFFDYLRKNDAYDNSKIIITSDHGYYSYGWLIDENDNEKKSVYGYALESFDQVDLFNPLLLYKDFDSNEFKSSDEFMTIADVPYLALKDVSLTNPYTNNEISMDYKNENEIFYLQPMYRGTSEKLSEEIDRTKYNITGGAWRTLSGKNIFDKDAWGWDFNVDNTECIKGGSHNLVFHEKSTKDSCGLNYKESIYKCSECGLSFYDKNCNNLVQNTDNIIIDIPHEFINYIPNNDEDTNTHGTKSAYCEYGCGTINTLYDENTTLGHLYQYEVINKASSENDGYIQNICTLCKNINHNIDKEIIPKIKSVNLEYNDVEFQNKEYRPKVFVFDSDDEIISDEFYNLRYKKNATIGKAEITIIFVDKYEGEKVIYFNINPPKPKIKKAYIENNEIIIKIDDNEKISGYEVIYSNDKEFNNNNNDTKNFKYNANNLYKLKLYDGNTYKYVKVRSYKLSTNIQQNVYSEWNICEVK